MVNSLYQTQIYLQTPDGDTIAQKNSGITVADSFLIENIRVVLTSTQVGISTNLTLSFQLSWILPANTSLVLVFQTTTGISKFLSISNIEIR
jgi:hypothetical protein